MLDVSSEEITDGALLQSMLALAAPLVVQNFVRVFQQVADLFWIGRYTGAAVAGVGLVVPLVSLLIVVVAFPTYVGTQVLVSQRVGGGDGDPQRALFTGVAVAAVSGLVVGGVAYLAAAPLVDLVASVRPGAGVDGDVRRAAIGYLRVTALGLAAYGVPDTIEAAFIGWGDSRASLYVNVVTVGVNVVLDPVFIFGLFGVPELGAAGAALASVLGAVVGLLVAVALVGSGRNDGMFARTAVHLDRAEFRELLDVGVPTGAQQAARQVIRVGIYVVVFVTGGAAGLAAYLVGARVASVAFIPAQGLQQAAQSVVGQNLGAGKPARARSATYAGAVIAAGGLALLGVGQWLVPRAITGLLAPELDPVAAGLSVDYLRILAYGYPALGLLYLFEGGFNGARRTRTSFAATLVQYGAVRLPLAVGVGVLLGVGVHAVFWAVTVSNVAAAVGLGAYYRYSVADGMLDRAADRAAGATEG